MHAILSLSAYQPFAGRALWIWEGKHRVSVAVQHGRRFCRAIYRLVFDTVSIAVQYELGFF